MASVIINSGAPEADDRPDRIPKDKWRDLMWVKRDFAKTRIKYDCRCLLEFVQDADAMWQELGFESAEDMICKGYELNLDEVHLALEWLKIKAPDEAVKYETAVKSGRKMRAERNERIRALHGQGMTQQQIADEVGLTREWVNKVLCEEKAEISEKTSQEERAKSNNVSDRTQRKIDRIRNIDPDLADDCENKKIKVAEAERMLGLAPSNFLKVAKMLAKLNRLELMDLQARITAILQEQ